MSIKNRIKRGLKHRDPLMAAILNFFLWGLGYIYAGRRLFLGGALLLFTFVAFLVTEMIGQNPLQALAYALGAWLVLSAAFAHDAYLEIKKRGEEKPATRDNLRTRE